MENILISTKRLILIAGAAEIVRAEINDRLKFSDLMDALVPDDWPPPLNDADSMEYAARFHEENPDAVGWGVWYFVLKNDENKKRVLIGSGGFKGKPASDGIVEIGYSIMAEYQNRGYATEATRGLLGWAFQHDNVNCVIAETFPDLTPSIRVLKKNGFVNIGIGTEEGTIRFRLLRNQFENQNMN